MIDLRATLVGASVDVGGSTFLAYVFVPIWLRIAVVLNVSPVDAYANLVTSPAYHVGALVAGAAFNFLGGATAAWLAGRSHALHGVLSTIPCILIIIFQLISPLAEPVPGWFKPVSILLAVLAATLGGQVVKRHAESRLTTRCSGP